VLIVVVPWLAPGYLFGTDWPGPRHLSFPTYVDSFAVLQAALAMVGRILSAEAAGKGLIIASLYVAGLTAYRALPVGGFIPRAVASLVYVLNPFVYGRLEYGQYFLIAGYAILPWVASRSRHLLVAPRLKSALLLAASLSLLGILDLHLLIPAAVVLATLLLASVAERHDAAYLAGLGRNLLLAVLLTVIASSYWLVPLVTGSSLEGRILASFGPGDLNAFQTVSWACMASGLRARSRSCR
jgi:hypothetical protein